MDREQNFLIEYNIEWFDEEISDTYIGPSESRLMDERATIMISYM